MQTKPTEIAKVNESTLRISWSDEVESILSSETLRSHCPCALCREKRGEGSHDAPSSVSNKKRSLAIVEATADESLSLVKIWAIGNYAIGIEWGDGHAQGIFDWKLLRRISGS